MIILAVNTHDPKDIPGKVTLEFATEAQCEQTRSTMTSWLKFDSFKVTSQCVRKS
jgi:hypothetical protein